jgi:hypothetical protein
MNIYYDSDNESYESDDDEFIYDPEEPSSTKYNIVICQLNYDEEIYHHYLTLLRLKTFTSDFLINFSTEAKLEIAECIYLPSDYCISILKTIWLKLIQRVWKKIYKEKKLIISLRRNINSLKHREIYGKWPNNCLIYPTLKGMLSNLSRASRASSRASF